jgi:predicted ArsR family transcriptional regulator
MAMAADVLALLDHERRRSIACAALDAPVTIGEIADRLDLADGAIRSTVERLARDGLLSRSDQAGRRPGTTVAAYQVAAAYAEQVRERCRPLDAATLDADREVVLVPLAALRAAAVVLTASRPRVVGWAVRTRDPQLSLMLGLRREATPEERDAFVLQLREAGADCGRLFVGESFAPDALFSYAAALAQDEPPALPAGS